MSDMSIPRGDRRNFSVPVTDNDGVVDLTNYTAYYTAKKVKTQVTPDISLAGTIPSPATGVIEFSLLPTHTDIDIAKYFFDIEITNTGDPTDVHTVNEGVLEITQDTRQ